MAVHKLEQAKRKFKLKISTTKTKSMGFQGKEHMRTKIVINGKIIEQVRDFMYLTVRERKSITR